MFALIIFILFVSSGKFAVKIQREVHSRWKYVYVEGRQKCNAIWLSLTLSYRRKKVGVEVWPETSSVRHWCLLNPF